ncbi:MAG: hypothetical protein GY714_03500 [Desulfobacterales bacterium]|nr:hypothetical protein [Desulfobacterales bacterium]MCP4162025.1 hypothetical protein [Deltaproteobacteria bacterium]
MFLLLMTFFSVTLAKESALAGPAGVWRGEWSSPRGYIYVAEMHLKAPHNGKIEGHINWIMQRSPRAADQSKIGTSGTEFVKGTFDISSRVLSIAGYGKDDPNVILGLDKYRLLLADNDNIIGGITWNHGSWEGKFFLTRIRD